MGLSNQPKGGICNNNSRVKQKYLSRSIPSFPKPNTSILSIAEPKGNINLCFRRENTEWVNKHLKNI